jgi:hypothetical protein
MFYFTELFVIIVAGKCQSPSAMLLTLTTLLKDVDTGLVQLQISSSAVQYALTYPISLNQDLLAESKKLLEYGELTPEEYKLKISGIKKDYPNGFVSCGADGLRFALMSQDISG